MPDLGNGYGIHGTPEPQNIGKTESHGCVRLTNWDAAALGKMVRRGVKVDFRLWRRFGAIQIAPIKRAWRRSILARPYIWRLTSLSLVI
jgi:hypothetical protein